MNSDKMDKIFKNKLEEHQTPLNTDALWEKIAPEVIEEKKDSKKVFFFWFFGIATLSAISLWFVIGTNTPQNSIKITSSIEQTSVAKETICDEVQVDFLQSSNREQILDGNDNAKQVQKVQRRSPNAISLIEKSDLSLNAKHSQPNQTNAKGSEKGNTKQVQNNTELKPMLSHTKSNLLDTKNEKGNNANAQASENSFAEKMPIAIEIKEIDSNEKSVCRPLPSILKYLTSVDTKELSISIPIIEDKKVEEDSNNKKNYFSIAPFYMYERIGKSLKTNDSTYFNLLDKRKSSEKNLESFQAGININWHHHSGLYLGTGLQYTQINEKFSYYKQTSELFSSLVNLTKITTTVNKQIYNRFKLIDIPLHAGFEFGKEKWKFSAELGVLINLKLKPSGQIFGLNETFVKYNSTDNPLFKRNIGVSYNASLGIGRKINDSWTVSAHLGLRYFPNSFNLEAYAIDQKYINSGLKIKCSYRIAR